SQQTNPVRLRVIHPVRFAAARSSPADRRAGETIPRIRETPMKPDLPEILDRYFAAQNCHDIDAMVACFASNAAVRDEAHDIVGTSAIRAWKKETSAKY